MSEQYDVVIIGGGVIGLTAAIGMKQRHFSVAVVDAGSLCVDLSQRDARVYAVNQASQALFETLEVWSAISNSRISPYRQMDVWDAKNEAHIEFDARLIGEDRLGNIIEEAVIKKALLDKASELGIILLANSNVSNVAINDDCVKLSCGKKIIRGQLLIVADGALSKTRDKLGVNLTSWPYHQHAVVTDVKTEKSHHATAYQVFNADGPLAFLPLRDAHHSSIVWSTSSKRAEQLIGMNDQEFNQELTDAFAAKLGHCDVMGKRYQFPLLMRHVNQYQGNRWIIMGDAAHTIHPLAGLGLNVGLEDISTWLNIVDGAKNDIWMSRYLKAYQRQRKYAVWKIIVLMQGLKSLFLNPLSPVVGVRGMGLNLCNNLPQLKRFFIDHARGNPL